MGPQTVLLSANTETVYAIVVVMMVDDRIGRLPLRPHIPVQLTMALLRLTGNESCLLLGH
jgi:hypothetical protein